MLPSTVSSSIHLRTVLSLALMSPKRQASWQRCDKRLFSDQFILIFFCKETIKQNERLKEVERYTEQVAQSKHF